jgi:hypothetical protein
MATIEEAQFYAQIMLHKKHTPESMEYQKAVDALQHIPAPMLEFCAQRGIRIRLYAPGEPLSREKNKLLHNVNVKGFYDRSKIYILSPSIGTIVHEIFHFIDDAVNGQRFITKQMLNKAPNEYAKTSEEEYFAEMGRIWSGARRDSDPLNQRTRDFGYSVSPKAMQVFDGLLGEIENKLANQVKRPYRYEPHTPLVQEAPRSKVEAFWRSILNFPKVAVAPHAWPDNHPLPKFSQKYGRLGPNRGDYYSVPHENDGRLAEITEKWRRLGVLIYPETYEPSIFRALRIMEDEKITSNLILPKQHKSSVYISPSETSVSHTKSPQGSGETNLFLTWNVEQGIGSLVNQLRQISGRHNKGFKKELAAERYGESNRASFRKGVPARTDTEFRSAQTPGNDSLGIPMEYETNRFYRIDPKIVIIPGTDLSR